MLTLAAATIAVLLAAAMPSWADVALQRDAIATTARSGALEVRVERLGEGLVLAGASAGGTEVLRGRDRRLLSRAA